MILYAAKITYSITVKEHKKQIINIYVCYFFINQNDILSIFQKILHDFC